MLRKLICLLLALCFTVSGYLPAFSYQPQRGLCFKTVDWDVGSSYPAEDFIVIRDQNDWQRVWSTLQGKDILDDNEFGQAPKVDFSKNMLIAAFGGRQPAAYYNIQIEKISVADDKILVNVVKNGPEDMIGRPNLTSPYHIVMIPKSSLGVKFLIKGTPSEIMPQELTLAPSIRH
jgi:hypothetical protein